MTVDGRQAGRRSALIAFRAFFGFLTLAAIGTQLTVHIRHAFSVINFFSYFTNLSNLFAAGVLLIGAMRLMSRQEPTVTDDIIRGTATVCMALVGIVFTMLLTNEDVGTLLPWVNTVTHYVMPVVVVLDWLYQPPRSTSAVRQIGYWLILPAVYSMYAIVRGALMGFYPYPFFNPAKAGGYGGVALYCVGMLVVFLVMSWALLMLGNELPRRVT